MTTAVKVRWLSNGITVHAYLPRKNLSICAYGRRPIRPRDGGAVCTRCEAASR